MCHQQLNSVRACVRACIFQAGCWKCNMQSTVQCEEFVNTVTFLSPFPLSPNLFCKGWSCTERSVITISVPVRTLHSCFFALCTRLEGDETRRPQSFSESRAGGRSLTPPLEHWPTNTWCMRKKSRTDFSQSRCVRI